MRWPWRRTPHPAPPLPNYVREWQGGPFNIEYVEHIDGVSAHDAPVPPRRHTCWAQTRGFMHMEFIRRCPCGAISLDGKYWMDRNTAKAKH